MNEMIEALQKLVSFQSIAKEEGPEYPYGKEVHRAKEYVLNLAKSFGMRVTDVPGKYAYIEIGEGPRLIGILSHLDVVPAGDGWTQDPFGGEIVDGKIYGRGTTDDKGPTIAVLYAMKTLKEKSTPPARIRLILGQTEENGEWRDIEAYTEAEEIPECGFTPDGDFPAIQNELGAMVFQVEMPRAESGFREGEGGTAPNMVPAHARVKTKFGSYEASGKACHGCAPWLGVNGISALMEKVHRAEPENRFAEMYADLIGKTIYGEKLGIAAEDESGKLTLNAGLLEVGADKVTLMVDIRYPAKKNPDEISGSLVRQFSSYGASCECVYQVRPLYTPLDSPVLGALLSAYREVTGDESRPISIGGGTYAKAMRNMVAFGPNFPGHENREHMEDEYILVDDFLKLEEIYERALVYLLDSSDSSSSSSRIDSALA
ncbi:MAG: Sapep family Mn(2+)-dependent dipeptidase [Mogibacterium sp.]|uniref:Sapep family Mn(2+)-dependent dipeptidase n=1 Tax=Mogibacterium sp. TaxID=2049035 RepID=UPI001A5602C7|nr:Sapep family Mn(2+)-dependent dipeptidase [Mogibacterium sp.]MBL6469223.1 Sapep family Mn(2+)-dependent dipeptidase [Mogibacterium sp.]